MLLGRQIQNFKKLAQLEILKSRGEILKKLSVGSATAAAVTGLRLSKLSQ